MIFHEGDPGDTLHRIDSGHVAIRATSPLGDVVTHAILGPSDTFGEQALIDPVARRTATAAAVESAETLTLARDDFEALRRDHPTTDRLLVEALAAQVRRLSEHLLEALYVPVERRVLRRLLVVASLYEHDGRADVPLTQEDLASMAGTSRPTANRVLKELEETGVVATMRGRITVQQIDELARLAR